jgi:transposase
LINEEEFMDIRALHRQGLTYAEIGRIVGRDWRTVKRYLTEGAQPRYRRKRMPSKLDPFKPLIDQWLVKDAGLEATRIHQDLSRDYGFTGSYPTVQRYVERARPRTPEETDETEKASRRHRATRPRSTGPTSSRSAQPPAWSCRSTASTWCSATRVTHSSP